MRRRKLIIIICLSVLAFLIVGCVVSEVVLANQAEARISSTVQKRLDLASPPEVTIDAHPILWKLYTGQIDEMKIDARDVTYGKFKADQIVLTAKNFQFDSGAMLSTNKLIVKSVDQAGVKIVISEASVNAYAQGILPGSSIKLEKNKVRYVGNLTYFGQTFDLDITGKAQVSGHEAISFAADAASVAKMAIPDVAKPYVTEILSNEFKLPSLPFTLDLIGVQVEPGKIVIEGKISDFGTL